ncbi:MAG: proteasome-activating nucleotidase [Candidatus Methanomethylicia archaeon]|nr:proteasome-activating nucleotidase [Candidatus Methanomethylicia archaeon]MCX8169091.1 proteasome-activating nucleotidase [Candidatus Methanomethylicia archaeon]MDW7988823.1 proteasome-activating nucleotidase [Nitrososphaerota archaeon]
MTFRVNGESSAQKNYSKALDYQMYLEKRLLQIEEELRLLNMERERLLEEITYLRNELEKMKTPPLIEAYIVDVLNDGRVIVKSSTGPNLVVQVSSEIDVKKLRPYIRVALNQRNFAVVEVLPQTEDPYVQVMEIIERPSITYDDIGGLEEQKREIRESIELPLKHPELFERVGIDPPKGVLLYGPPGCGKTLLAKAVANETNATFIRTVGSELVKKYIGEGARIVKEIFALARRKAPSIVFIDEIDAIGARRLGDVTSGEREVYRTLAQLLYELDGFEPRGNVKVIAATNRIDILDEALLRPGRFDRIIYVPLPNDEEREKIFKVHMKKLNLDEGTSIKILVKETSGMTGADIMKICVEAGMNAIRRNMDKITMSDFLKAIEKVKNERGKKESVTTIYR